MDTIAFGILTVSDTCSSGAKVDTSGPALAKAVLDAIENACIMQHDVVPDNEKSIADVLVKWTKDCDVILTTGGTGISPRDVTPEATRSVITREVPGIAYGIITKSLQITPLAMLSRLACGIRDNTLIVNLPGSSKGAIECFRFIKDVIPHAVDLISDKKKSIRYTHEKLQFQSHESKVKIDPPNRNRVSQYELLEVSEALKKIKEECPPTTDTEEIPVESSLTRALAENVLAEEAIPAFRASIKDGYAVLARDGKGKRKVRYTTAAGDQPEDLVLERGEIVRISTGAPVPGNADAVVQVEDTEILKISKDGQEEIILIKVDPEVGQDIREIGSDVKAGEVVLRKYDHVTPFHMGVFTMLGKTTVKVFKRKSIGVISSGNELKGVNEELKSGQIRDSNKVTLMCLLKNYGYESSDCGIARDNPDSVKTILEQAFRVHDVIVSSGGVSMGEFDLFKQVLIEDFQAVIHFGRVNMKPGKPTVFATLEYEGNLKVVFSLPGNPVSCSVTCLIFVIPALRYMERKIRCEFPWIQVSAIDVVGVNFKKRDVRPEYVRVRTLGRSVTSTGNQISSRLNSMIGANGLLLVPGQNSACPHQLDVMLFAE